MPSALTEAHIEGERRLRLLTKRALTSVWNGLPRHDRENVDQWLSEVLPVVEAGQRQSVNLTNAYLARSLDRQPLPLDTRELIGAGVRNGTPPAEVYERPFITLWSGLSDGLDFAAASNKALARATSTGAMDVQLSMRATATAVDAADPNIYGYERVADATACEFCRAVDGAYVKGDGYVMALHNGCVAGDSVVWMPPGSGSEAAGFGVAHAATRRWYEGEVVILKTSRRHELTVTPNHPILTAHGWVAAGDLREGDSVVSRDRLNWVGGRVPDEEDVPARIEDRFRAGAMAALALVPLTSEQLHGDGPDGEVDVVPLHRGLEADDLAALFEPAQKLPLAIGSNPAFGLSGNRCLCERRLLRRTTARCGVRRRCAGSPLPGRFPAGRKAVLLARTPKLDSLSDQVVLDRATVYTEPFGERQYGLAGEVEVDSIRESRRIDWSGHVFNLVTSCGWYTANGIVVHNCGCGLRPRTEPHDGAVFLPDGTQVRFAAYGPLNDKVAVQNHGELGPVLTAPGHHFTTESQLH